MPNIVTPRGSNLLDSFSRMTKQSVFLFVVLLLSIVSQPAAPLRAEDLIDFRSQVQPILSDRCFHCHGPDSTNQDSEYRLDSKANVFADLGGYAGVVPGDLKASEVHARIRSTDEGDMMPPPDSNRSLSEEEKRILDLWIKQGAPYQEHWSFEIPSQPEVPTQAIGKSDWLDATKDAWSDNPIDAFVGRRLIEEQWKPSPPADPAILLRRASMTLTGLLPPRDLQDRFDADLKARGFQAAYAEAINELLASMGYAEHQALRWLDAARYADTDGYQNDHERTNWPWRDWVIKAMHENMPFDQFTIEQLAGDMLPSATHSQRLATAFNRNHRQNAEGGALAEEFIVENAIDRVETTSIVWLGLTMGCCRCHDHKYDPLSQEEFFKFYGYFNNIGEKGIGRGIQANPTLESQSPLIEVDQKWVTVRDEAKKQVDEAKKGLDQRMQAYLDSLSDQPKVEPVVWSSTKIRDVKLDGDGELAINPDNSVQYSPGNGDENIVYHVQLGTDLTTLTAIEITALVDSSFGEPRKLAPSVNGNFVLTDFKITLNGNPVKIASSFASFEQENYPVKAAIDDNPKSGWAVFGNKVKAEPVSASFRLAESVKVSADDSLNLDLAFGTGFPNHVIGKFQVKVTDRDDVGPAVDDGIAPDVRIAMAKSAESRTSDDKKLIRKHYEAIDEPLAKANEALKTAQANLHRQGGPKATVMVMRERKGEPIPAYLLNRGQYNEPVKDKPLSRGVPKALLPTTGDDGPSNRLELARWLVSSDNPLTARVIVNRIWQDHFGIGLVKSSDDFGLQGEIPSHPALLDWLAVEFIDSGWDIQAMHRLIVTSATYQQSSKHDPKRSATDPENRLLSRGPRYRSDGFSIRDVALQASGLLADKVGGPSVKPYQPGGLWASVAANVGTRYTPARGADLYRKSMYTYWKRAVNPPRQTIFDASGREVCNVQSRRTNTPLQALVLMNDPTFVESARKLAERALLSGAEIESKQIGEMYRWAIGRPADEQTLSVLAENLNYFRRYYASQKGEAKKLLSIGSAKSDESLPETDLAAMTAVAHLILNLDEFLTVE